MIKGEKPNLDNIENIFTDYDGSFRQHGGKMLNGVDDLFDDVKSRDGKVFLLTNRSAEACENDPLIADNFGKKSKWDNSKDKSNIIAATGALFLNKNFLPIEEHTSILNFTQRKEIANALLPYIKEISLIEWIEKDKKSKLNRTISQNKIVGKIKEIKPFKRIRRYSDREKVRKFHFMHPEPVLMSEIKRRTRRNRREAEHVVKQKDEIKAIEYVRRASSWYLRRTGFEATPKDVLRLLKNNEKTISKIVVGFKTKKDKELLKLQISLSKTLYENTYGLIISPDLSNLHILNKRDKAIAIEMICNQLDLDMSKSMMIGNSGIDIPPGVLLAKHGGIFVYVGNEGESKRSMMRRFLKELRHPLFEKHYLRLVKQKKKIDDLIRSGHIVFLDPKNSINNIYTTK